MPTKTTKKPRARKAALSLKSRVDSLARALETLQCAVNGKAWDVESLKADMQADINKLSKEEFKNLEIRYDRHIDDLRRYVGKQLDRIDEKLKLLDERLCDEVNKGHALYLHIEAFEKRLQHIEGKLSHFLTMDDLRKVNVTMGVLEKDLNHGAEAFSALRKEWDDANLSERMNMVECDIEKLHDPQSFGREPAAEVTVKDVVLVLQSARQRVATKQDQSAMSAITFCTLPGDLRSRALLALYLAVHSIWCMPEQAPTVLTDNVMCELLYQWYHGQVTCREDTLLAFDVAIKKESLRA